MRTAATVLSIKQVTGEPRETETLMRGSERAVIRSPETWSDPRGWEPKVQCEPLRT